MLTYTIKKKVVWAEGSTEAESTYCDTPPLLFVELRLDEMHKALELACEIGETKSRLLIWKSS